MIYDIFKNLLFQLSPETAHNIGLQGLNFTYQLGLNNLLFPNCNKLQQNQNQNKNKNQQTSCQVMGLNFPNKVGLAAGLDKNGDYIDALFSLGFGFLEVGTVTPKPQPGNEQPRLFRLTENQAIINRMGFNNKGVEHLVQNVRKFKAKNDSNKSKIIGINIGKNKDTPIENAADDYLICLEKSYEIADYIAINISSPNTKNLRELQKDDALDDLLSKLKNKQQQLSQQYGKYTPIAVKIAPDLDDNQLKNIAEISRKNRIDAIISNNTTLTRVGVENLPVSQESGGLSGKPIFEMSNQILQKLANLLQNEIPIIAVGGISSVDDAKTKLQLGAKLVQIYSGFIFKGPPLIQQCAANI